MSTFKTIVLTVFSLATIIGIAVFAMGGISKNTGENIGEVELWGTLSESKVQQWLRESTRAEGVNLDLSKLVKYKKIDSENYDEAIIEALATGEGPDLFFLAQDKIIRFRDKIRIIPFDNYSERKFKNEFVEEGELYLGEEGIYGLPLTIDPMITYWNRSMFSSAGIAQPPELWEEVYSMSEQLSQTQNNSDLTQSAVALGEYGNIKHAKEILSATILQAGSPIVKETTNGQFVGVLSQNDYSSGPNPSVTALRFYTQFSNPSKSVYSWNSSMDEARKEFLAEDLAIYFGFSSELETIRRANPNLNFDIAQFPKRGENSAITFGKMQALSISRNAQNLGGALKIANVLTGQVASAKLAEIMNLAPPRRDLLSKEAPRAYKDVFYKAALRADAWLDPNPKKTEEIFATMIDSVISGRRSVGGAVGLADSQIKNLLAN